MRIRQVYEDTTLAELRRRRTVAVSFIEVDRVAKSCIQGNLERLHVTLALINDLSQFCDLPVDLRLIAFQAFHGAVMWKVKEGLANLVAF